MGLYSYTDKQIAALNRQYVRLFRKIRLLNFDELNVLNDVSAVYKEADKKAKAAYLKIAEQAYLFGLKEAERAGFKRNKRKYDINRDWILDFLEEEDEVTLYRYAPEWERKKQRLVEALAATSAPKREIDKALRYMIQQTTHYADKATSEAELQAFHSCGVTKVMWITERDDRVCEKCEPLDGKVFDIDKVPQIPAHYRCRCTLKIVS